jgi:excinuclease ABC subunit A
VKGEIPLVIAVRGASEHNLKAVDVDLPRGSLTIVTGVSGSGKSSLAFDTICAEGRRRYLETFSSYARQFLGRLSRPSVAHIDGLSPAVSVDQSSIVRNPRSTVGTLTELYDLLRLLWARRGIRSEASAAPVGSGGAQDAGTRAGITRSLFSFNSPHGACPRCRGLGVEDRLDPDLLVVRPDRSVRDGALRITTPTGYLVYSQVTLDVLDEVCRAHGFSVDVPWNILTADQRDVILNGSDRIRIPYGKHPLASRLRWSGITARPREEGTYKGILPVMEQILRQKRNRNILRFVRSMPCRECGGTRLRREALAVTFRGFTIAEAAGLSIDDLCRFFDEQRDERNAPGAGAQVELAIRQQVIEHSRVLQHLGLGYLSLDRESTTLSGGEAQRIRLARQAGIGLGGVLYVLDEPSIGLHQRETGRLLDILRQVRDRGNTVLVVEHDEQTLRRADWVVDVGPAAGDAGGEVLFSGPAARFVSSVAEVVERSRTQAFISGRERIPVPSRRRAGNGTLVVRGVTKHNLQNVAVEFKLGAFNVVTGVSGSGKSTLLEETVRLLRGGPGDRASARASDRLDKVIEIDQAPIGRTPRSNPATYTGLFDSVRGLFAAEPDAVRCGFGKGRFSFNVRGGRCEACEGAGIQQIGMQFLGTVPLVCDTCGGRRFNDETLAVRYRGKHIDDVLEMSIDEASAFFGDQPSIARALGAMCTLGLGYLALGHPATMLSGGEAQRVKLAAELSRPGTGRTLYVLDEPTTGLHAADIVRLLAAIEGLVAKGNTVVAIEHHLDVIKVADWTVDLGPGSGAEGGRVVAIGTPEAVAESEASLTGAALGDLLQVTTAGPALSHSATTIVGSREQKTVGIASAEEGAAPASLASVATRGIRITNVTTHNLQHVDVEIPAGQVTVITGVSGSGKSSLAFDTLFAEGQRRFAETFSTYARRLLPQSDEAGFDECFGLTPTVAISQQSPSRNPRSTVATLTEIHDYYRLLFARAGTRFCPRSDHAGPGAAPIALRQGTCLACGFSGPATLTASMFSPNSEAGACPRCNGLGHVLECDPAKLVTNPDRPLGGGAMSGHKCGRFYGDPHGQHVAILTAAGKALGIDFSVPWSALDEPARSIAMRGAGDRAFDVEWHYVRGARHGTHRFESRWPGFLEYVGQEYERKHADRRGEALEPLMVPVRCATCGGGKLKAEALAVRFGGVNIHQLLGMTVEKSLAFFETAGAEPARRDGPEGVTGVSARNLVVTRELRADVTRRLASLRDAGLDYLALDRPAATLSSGEAQRVRLAAQLGSGLTGITYVLDEPTIGLHPRDTARLIGLLRALGDAGNTVVVVEHDLDVITSADYVIEIGPGAGRAGGRIVSRGTPADIARDPSSATGRHLKAQGSRLRAQGRGSRLRAPAPGVTVRGASVHNLRDLDVDIPFGGLVAITGVSGSGKSSLIFDVLAPSVERALENGGAAPPVNCRDVTLHAPLAALVRVGPGLVASSPWSTPATHIGIFERVREAFAHTDEASARGLRKQHFSTQLKGGRCEACEGIGQVRVAMDFLPDVWTECETCNGKRYGPDVLSCTIDGRSIADVLDMTVDEARERLESWHGAAASHAAPIRAGLDALADVGLGYLRLGQAARSLSGGERQRLVLAAALVEQGPGARLFLFDEPTTGLHAEDVGRLLGVFDRLIDAGHSLVVIEHNLDVIERADWAIDLGPEGGDRGGRLVAAGPPEVIAHCVDSPTGQALALRSRQWP